MSSRPRSLALLWISLITLMGLVTLVSGLADAWRFRSDWGVLGLFLIIVFLADLFRVHMAAFSIAITVSTVVLFGSALVFGELAVVLAIGTLAADIVLRKPTIKAVYNASMYSVMTYCSALVWRFLIPQEPSYISLSAFFGSFGTIASWFLAGLVFVVINALCVITVVALVDRASILHVARHSLSGIMVQFLTLPALGVLFAILYRVEPFSLVLIILPLIAVYFSLRSVEQVRKQTIHTIQSLADLLDRRDYSTNQHSIRVSEYTRLICNELRLPMDMTESIVLAARIHDLGKLAVPDSILFKPYKLNESEWRIMKKHATEGAEILAPMEAYSESLTFVRHHHERWDGKGYPDGLSGQDIPLGARIICVADSYDAMVSARPYRQGMHKLAVLTEIEQFSGSQFDPSIVQAFLDVMRRPVSRPPSQSDALETSRSGLRPSH